MQPASLTVAQAKRSVRFVVPNIINLTNCKITTNAYSSLPNELAAADLVEILIGRHATYKFIAYNNNSSSQLYPIGIVMFDSDRYNINELINTITLSPETTVYTDASDLTIDLKREYVKSRAEVIVEENNRYRHKISELTRNVFPDLLDEVTELAIVQILSNVSVNVASHKLVAKQMTQ